MAIQKIFKGSDLLFDVRLVDATGTPYRIKDTAGFSIKFYTRWYFCFLAYQNYCRFCRKPNCKNKKN